ncbi:hypothetical protein N431DRAFT_341880 [Stipitochalara longipes BDJ]|nr:hypothetical protein N431DRAFT_341880 [Stipitochalara longipes BDJ]
MSFASPVWKKFIFPPWKTVAAKILAIDPNSDLAPDAKKIKMPGSDKKGREKGAVPAEEVDFTDDNGEALLILLRIAHLRFQDNPTTLPYQTLLQVAVLCDQYQCINLVRPWLHQWLADEELLSLQPRNENWLFIAWVFGREEVFKNLATKMVRGIVPSNKSVHMTSIGPLSTRYKISDPMPDGILDRIAAVRMEVITQLLGVAHARVEKCLQSKETLCRSDSYNARPEDCDAIVLGSFVRGLQELNVLPKMGNKIHTNIIRMSVEEFADKLSTMGIRSPHSQCAVSPLKEAIAEKLLRIPDPVLDSHRRHMKIQSGVGQ